MSANSTSPRPTQVAALHSVVAERQELIGHVTPKIGLRNALLLAVLVFSVQVGTFGRSIAAHKYGWFSYSVTGVSGSDMLFIRDQPRPDANVVGSLASNSNSIIDLGSSVELPNATWILIDYLGSVGWVNKRFLKQTDEGISREALGKVLNGAGIGIRFSDDPAQITSYSRTFENKCPYKIDRINPSVELTISDGMLGYYRERGFTLKTACLALTTFMVFEVQTGIALPRVDLSNDSEKAAIPLNIPDCFRNGTPLLDCQINYDWFWGKSASSDMPAFTSDMHTLGTSIDRVISRRAKSAISETYNGQDEFEKLFGPNLAEQAYANGGLVEFVEISRDLPRGYAYRLATRTMGGDSPESNAALRIGSKETRSTTNLRLPWNLGK